MDKPNWQKILDLFLSSNSDDWELAYILLQPLLDSKEDYDILCSMLLALVLFSPSHSLGNLQDKQFDKKLRRLLQKKDAYFFRKLSVLQHKIYAVTDKYAGAPEIQYLKMMELLNFQRFDPIVLPDIFNHRLTFWGGKYLQLAQWQLTHLLQHNALEKETVKRCLVSTIPREYMAQSILTNTNNSIQQLNLHFYIKNESKQLNELLQQYPSIAFLKNGLGSLPQALYQNKQLEFLYVSSNPIERIDSACKNWTSLEELRLSFCRQLKHFPKEMAALKQLKGITIEHCRLEEVPEAFFELRQLERLELKRNKIASISNKLAQLEQLQLLNLNQNLPLYNIPPAVFELKQLQQLWVKDCGITKLPKEITQMTQLQDLRLSHNGIKVLPRHFTNLENLVQLQLERTRIRCDHEFWETILALKSLKHLQIFGVPIRADIYMEYKDALQEKLTWFSIHEHYLY